MCALYIRDTVDDLIYEKEDWDRLVGVGRNRYFTWDPPGLPNEAGAPPRTALPHEVEVEFTKLRPGHEYPGRYEGTEFSIDTQGNVNDDVGQAALNPQDIPALIQSVKDRGGRFRITPKHRAVLARIPVDEDSWRTVYLGRLEAPFEFPKASDSPLSFDPHELRPGDSYPGPLVPAVEYRYRQHGGGTIAKRVPSGEVFARGRNAQRLRAAVQSVGTAAPITKVLVNRLGHAFWREAGVPRFLAVLDGDLEFPGDSA